MIEKMYGATGTGRMGPRVCDIKVTDFDEGE